MSEIYTEALPRGINPQGMWSQGKGFLKRHLVVTIITGNSIFERPRSDQGWFWSSRWIEMEGETEQALAHGDFEDFDNVDDLFDDMNREED